jgi:hypothetical protein
MRTTRERTIWTILAALLLAGAAAAWWTSDQWLPHAGPWTEQAWKKITRPGPDTLPPGKQQQPAAQARSARGGASEPLPPQPRKCVMKDGRITYTDQPCPKGTQEQPVDGAVTSLPRAQ